LFPGQDWEAPFYRSLAEEEGVNAVVLVAGGTSTLVAGQIAVARRLPILAVGEFGGAAGKIWNQLALSSPEMKLRSWGDGPIAAFVQQLKDQCSSIEHSRRDATQREQLLAIITAQRRQSAYASTAFIVLLMALFFGLVYPPVASAYTFLELLGLVSAGATGALVRTLIAGLGKSDARTSFLLGGIAGFVVGLAYLIPLWVGAPGTLEPKAVIISASDKIQFASAVLVAVSAGVGFDTVFNRLQKQAENVAVSPPH